MGRAVISTLVVAALFLAYVWTAKEVPPLVAHAPWADDPYDAVISFAFFFVPVLIGLCLLRAPSCRQSQPLPVRRVRELLLACRLTFAIVGATLASEWISVALQARHDAWTLTTAGLVAALTVLTVIALAGLTLVLVALRPVSTLPALAGPTWLQDIASVIEGWSNSFGPMSFLPRGLAKAVRGSIARALTDHPLPPAVGLAVAFGVLIAAVQGQEEGGLAWRPFLLYAVVAGSSMLAFVLGAGWHLRLLGRPTRMSPAVRRVIDAVVAGVASIPVTLALRGALRPMIAALPNRGSERLIEAGVVIAIAVGAGVLGLEAFAGTHKRSA